MMQFAQIFPGDEEVIMCEANSYSCGVQWSPGLQVVGLAFIILFIATIALFFLYQNRGNRLYKNIFNVLFVLTVMTLLLGVSSQLSWMGIL